MLGERPGMSHTSGTVNRPWATLSEPCGHLYSWAHQKVVLLLSAKILLLPLFHIIFDFYRIFFTVKSLKDDFMRESIFD